MSMSGLVLLPVLFVASFTAAQRQATEHLDRIHGAIVNNDQIVTVDGQQIPLGRVLVAKLTGNHSNQNIGWTQTNTPTAQRGLEDGRFATVLTIPADFSKAATSIGNPATARPATLEVQSSAAAGVADPLIGAEVTTAALSAFNSYLASQYLDNLYIGFSTLHDKLGQAAAGATKLSSGAGQLAAGIGTAANGATSLAAGLHQLSSGATALDGGAVQLSAGTDQLAAGAGQLSSGTARLASGLDRIDAGAAQLPADTQKLASGATALAAGNSKLASGLGQLSGGLDAGLAQLPNLTVLSNDIGTGQQQFDQTLAQLKAGTTTVDNLVSKLAASCGSSKSATCSLVQQLVASTPALNTAAANLAQNPLQGDVSKFASQSQTILGDIGEFQSGLNQASAGSQALATGSAQLAGGLDQLAANMPALAAGINQAAGGANQLAGGAAQLASGAQRLAGGAAALANGAGQLASGAASAAAGASTLAGGLGKLHAGADQLAGGVAQLASGLASAVNQIPDYTPAQRSKLAAIATQAIVTPVNSAYALIKGAGAAYDIALALAIAGLVSFLLLRALPDEVLTSTSNSLTLALRAYRPCISVVIFQSAVLSAVVGLIIGLDAGRALRLVLVSVIAGLAFAAVNQAMVALWGGRGRFAAMVVLVLTAPAAVISTTPGILQLLTDLTPIAPALRVLRAILLGGSGLIPGLLELVVWFAVGIAATVVAVARRRTVKPSRLRFLPGLASPVGV
jgi:putative membrane protein